MFKRREDQPEQNENTFSQPIERITSVIGEGIMVTGRISGEGGVRIEGTFEGEVNLNGLLVIGPTGKVNCKDLQTKSIIVAGAVRGNITAKKVDIRETGRVWGDVRTEAISTEEGAFLRGQMIMEEDLQIDYFDQIALEEMQNTASIDQDTQSQA
jgi:cytoskeletal protein CcmA (bactofilin family)